MKISEAIVNAFNLKYSSSLENVISNWDELKIYAQEFTYTSVLLKFIDAIDTDVLNVEASTYNTLINLPTLIEEVSNINLIFSKLEIKMKKILEQFDTENSEAIYNIITSYKFQNIHNFPYVVWSPTNIVGNGVPTFRSASFKDGVLSWEAYTIIAGQAVFMLVVEENDDTQAIIDYIDNTKYSDVLEKKAIYLNDPTENNLIDLMEISNENKVDVLDEFCQALNSYNDCEGGEMIAHLSDTKNTAPYITYIALDHQPKKEFIINIIKAKKDLKIKITQHFYVGNSSIETDTLKKTILDAFRGLQQIGGVLTGSSLASTLNLFDLGISDVQIEFSIDNGETYSSALYGYDIVTTEFNYYVLDINNISVVNQQATQKSVSVDNLATKG